MASKGGSDDESAPLFFLLAILSFIVVPWTIGVVWTLLFWGSKQVESVFPTTTEDGARPRQCMTSAMTTKRDKEVAKLQARSRLFTKGYIMRLVVLFLLWCWLTYIVLQYRTVMATNDFYENFDPYALLEVSRGTKAAEIKKAYRKLSLKYHPDRNQNDPLAADKFMKMKKAYDALTDPMAKRNYERYGNPDGPSRVEIGMAIPKISKENQGIVLVLFVVFFILGLPLSLIWCMQGTGSMCENGVLRSTMEVLAQRVSPSLDVKTAQELLLASAESRDVAMNPGDLQALQAIKEALPASHFRSSKPSKKAAAAAEGSAAESEGPSKAEVLFVTHVCRRHELLAGSPLAAELEALLLSWRRIALAMADLAGRQSFGDALEAALELHQCLVQALEPGFPAGSSVAELLQVPHFDAEKIKLWRKGPRKAAGLKELAELTADDLKASLEPLALGSQEVADVVEFAAVLPKAAVKKTAVSVSGEDTVCQGDIATMRVLLERGQLQQGEAAGSAHTPHFASAGVTDAWWVLFTPAGRGEKTRIVRLADLQREMEAKLKFRVPSASKIRCKIKVISEAYAGLCIDQTMNFDAKVPQEEVDDTVEASDVDSNEEHSGPGE
eukprot:TRINITY_DN22749_c0_g1_i3.p1 TRINITY_DN22749_c0_g1~~TRINITY_DN22749_c0_g1_i3.p1  ORF type:complete len:612 (+),score=197.31 TRINITY_DN22749_c0_g1_i3:79-1914(+)